MVKTDYYLLIIYDWTSDQFTSMACQTAVSVTRTAVETVCTSTALGRTGLTHSVGESAAEE